MNTHFCLIWLFKLGRQGKIIPKIQLCLESILNLPQIQKILAIWVCRWMHTLWFLPFPLQMATQCWHELHGTAKTQFIWWEQWTPPSFTWSKSKECDQGLRLLPSFVPIGFFWFAFYFKVMILWTAPTPCKLEQEHIGSEGAVCTVEESASRGMCLAAGAERHRWHSSLDLCTLSTLRELVSFLSDTGHHRTVPFNLKSAGFKALCWQ